jgi:sugar phosphate isomerase/epimerase
MLPCWLTDTVTSDLDRALHYTLLWGLEGVELRTIGTAEDRVPFVNEGKLKRRLAANELPAVAVVPGMFEGPVAERTAWLNELAAFDETLQFCRRLGCPCVVVSAFAAGSGGEQEQVVEALVRAGRAAAARGITVAVLNEYGMGYATGAALAGLLEAVNHPAVRAAWSPASALRGGEDPAAGLEALRRHVALVRCFDGESRAEAWTHRLPGEGSVDWPHQLAALVAAGFEGPISLEVHGEPRPKHGLWAATALIEMIRAARRG